jgi:hypothetical protein
MQGQGTCHFLLKKSGESNGVSTEEGGVVIVLTKGGKERDLPNAQALGAGDPKAGVIPKWA